MYSGLDIRSVVLSSHCPLINGTQVIRSNHVIVSHCTSNGAWHQIGMIVAAVVKANQELRVRIAIRFEVLTHAQSVVNEMRQTEILLS